MPTAAASPSGPLDGDVEHRIRAWGQLRFDFENYGHLVLGGLLRFETGRPWARNSLTSILGDDPRTVGESAAFYDHYWEPLGSHRFPSSWALDLSARHEVALGEGLHAWFKVTVTNAFDRDGMTSFSTYGETAYEEGLLLDANGQPIPVIDPGTGQQATDENGYPLWQTEIVAPASFVPGTNFGKATRDSDYQDPRAYLFTVGFSWR